MRQERTESDEDGTPVSSIPGYSGFSEKQTGPVCHRRHGQQGQAEHSSPDTYCHWSAASLPRPAEETSNPIEEVFQSRNQSNKAYDHRRDYKKNDNNPIVPCPLFQAFPTSCLRAKSFPAIFRCRAFRLSDCFFAPRNWRGKVLVSANEVRRLALPYWADHAGIIQPVVHTC